MDPSPTILSLDKLKVNLPQDVYNHLAAQYSILDNNNNDGGKISRLDGCSSPADARHIDMILQSSKTSPADTCCRVNLIQSSVDEVIDGMKEHLSTISDGHDFNVQLHETIKDLVIIRDKDSGVTNSDWKSLCNCSTPPNPKNINIFPTWPKRLDLGWPISHHAVVVDRFCGEAVLRGSNIFVRGVLSADSGIAKDEEIAVYADIRSSNSKSIARGLVLEKYRGTCVFLGVGISCCKRSEYFAQSSGMGVRMTRVAGPPQPSLNNILTGKMMLQNLPSVCVAHALDPQPDDVILDMCCAPGGKTTHVASLVGNKGLVFACDKSRKKMVSARDFFTSHGASCIIPLALDSTKSLLELADGQTWKSPKDIIDSTSTTNKDGLLNVKGFYANSFDRILLDPPCSALGLRPKLHIDANSTDDLTKLADYQKRFINNAVQLLKPGGTLTYSTCTFNSYENEDMVEYLLEKFPYMKLVPISSELPGVSGLSNRGLSEEQCRMVRRFDPCDKGDTPGFFLAKFHKSLD